MSAKQWVLCRPFKVDQDTDLWAQRDHQNAPWQVLGCGSRGYERPSATFQGLGQVRGDGALMSAEGMSHTEEKRQEGAGWRLF